MLSQPEQLISNAIAFVLNIPIWVIFFEMIRRNGVRREKRDDMVAAQLQHLADLVVILDKKISLIEKDLGLSANLLTTINDLTTRVTKSNGDMDIYFDKMRSYEKKTSELEGLLRSRTHWLSNCLTTIQGKLIMLFNEKGEIQYPPMP